MNDVIRKDRNLGRGFEIGHSYFCPSAAGVYDKDWLRRILETEIQPLLDEYWYDSPEKASELLSECFD